MADPDDRKFPPGDVPDTDDDEPQPWGAGAAPPGARWRRRALWAGAAAVAVVVAVTVGWPSVAPLMPGTVTALFEDADPSRDPELASLGARIEALEAAVARVEGGVASATATARAALPQSDAAQLGTRIEALETRPAPGPPAPDKRIDPLVEKVDALGGRLDRLERVAAATAGTPSAAEGAGTSPTLAALLAENARLAAELGRMTERIARLEAAGDPELAGKVEAAGARVEGIEADLKRLSESGRTRKGDALLLAVGQLREAASGSRPFDVELQLVLKAATGEAGIGEAAGPLAAFSRESVPTRAALKAQFPGLAARAAQAALAPEEGSWLNRTAARLSRVVTVRRVGQGAERGEGALAAIARAENRLAAGDLAAAAAALEGLEGAPDEIFGEWREGAGARATIDVAIARLSRRAIERFAAAGGAG